MECNNIPGSVQAFHRHEWNTSVSDSRSREVKAEGSQTMWIIWQGLNIHIHILFLKKMVFKNTEDKELKLRPSVKTSNKLSL